MLVAEANLYVAEGLRVAPPSYSDNTGCIDLLVRGIVPLLDEQTQVGTLWFNRLSPQPGAKPYPRCFFLGLMHPLLRRLPPTAACLRSDHRR